MAFYCPKCEPGHPGGYGWSPALCERHGQPDDDVDGEAAPDTPETRRAAFDAAMAAGDAARAFAIAREPFPVDSPDWPEDVRRPWGARRELARMALDAVEDAADADSDRREVPAVEDAPPWDGEHDGGGRLPMAGDFREPRR